MLNCLSLAAALCFSLAAALTAAWCPVIYPAVVAQRDQARAAAEAKAHPLAWCQVNAGPPDEDGDPTVAFEMTRDGYIYRSGAFAPCKSFKRSADI